MIPLDGFAIYSSVCVRGLYFVGANMADDNNPKPVAGAQDPPDAPDATAAGARDTPGPSDDEIMSRIARDAEEGAGRRSADRMADKMIDNMSVSGMSGDGAPLTPERIRGFADVAKVSADAAALRQFDLEIIKSNGQLYLTVVRCVGASLVLVVLAIAGLALYQLTLLGEPVTGTITIAVPDGLIALGSAAIGALAGLLTPLSGRR